MVPATGSTRRLRALALDQHGAEHIAALVGCNEKTIKRIRAGAVETVQAAIATTIAAVTTQLAGTRGSARRAAFDAFRAGWWPLDAWFDPDTDPEPSTLNDITVMHAVAGDLRWDQLDEHEQHLVVIELTGRCWSDVRIADHLRTSHSRIARTRDRLGVRAVPASGRWSA